MLVRGGKRAGRRAGERPDTAALILVMWERERAYDASHRRTWYCFWFRVCEGIELDERFIETTRSWVG